MAAVENERVMVSERVAPGMLPRVLNSMDMTIIFVAIVLFIVNASAIQRAGPSAYTFWILGFLAFLIPGALVTAQLGLMFPQEGSLYVWTQKALGPFWGFFAGFCAWWPGILVMAATGDAVVTIWQFIDTGGLPKNWEQGLVILAVLWFSAFLSLRRLRMTQNYANVAVIFYGAAIFVIGLAGILWLIGDGHSATGGFGTFDNWVPHSGTWTLFGLVILALLGIEVPLNMGVEIVDLRAIKKYLFWGSHTWAVIIALIALWFFVSYTVVYNYSFSRLLFVSGLERRMPAWLAAVDERKVPRNAVLAQTIMASAITVVAFGPWLGSNNTNKIFWMLQAAVTVIWCISMILLFADIYLVKRAFPEKFEEVRVAPTPVLFASGIVGMGASILGAIVTFKDPWVTQWTTHSWRVWLAIIVGLSALVAIAIYAISEFTHKREVPTPTPTPAG